MPPTQHKQPAEVQHIDAIGGSTPLGALGIDEWREAHKGDKDLQLVMRHVRSVSVPAGLKKRILPLIVQQLLHSVSRLTITDGVLYKKMIDSVTHECQIQIVCPAVKQEKVWRQNHEAVAHLGIKHTLTRVQYHFYWPQMEEVLRGVHSGCVACSLQKERNSLGPLNPLSVSCLLEVVALNLLSLGRPNDTYQNILVMVDMFTCYIWAVQ